MRKILLRNRQVVSEQFLMVIAGCMAFLAACAGVSPDVNGNGYENGNGLRTEEIEYSVLRGEIAVSAFDAMLMGPFLEEAARMFMDINPDVTVTVETFSSMPEMRFVEDITDDEAGVTIVTTGDTTQELRDYVNLIDAQFIGGGGPDILALDALPFHRYAREGRLVNLREFMESDPFFDINAYRVNIFDALETAGGLFMFPLDYAFEYVTFNPEWFGDEAAELEKSVFTHEQLAQIAEVAFHVANAYSEEHISMFPSLLMMGGGFHMRGATQIPALFRSQFMLNYSYFIDVESRSVNFSGGGFESLIETVKDFEERGFITPFAPLNLVGIEQRAVGGGAMQLMTMPRSIYDFRGSWQLLFEFYDMGLFGMMQEGESEIAGLLANNQGEIPFTVRHALGINSNSQNQQLAWEFIKFASSESMAQSPRISGLPTYIRAFEERAQTAILGGGFVPGAMIVEMRTDDPDGPQIRPAPPEIDLASAAFTPAQEAAIQAYTETVAYFTSRLDTFHIIDPTLDEIIFATAAEIFEGRTTVRDAAQKLENQLNLLLN